MATSTTSSTSLTSTTTETSTTSTTSTTTSLVSSVASSLSSTTTTTTTPTTAIAMSIASAATSIPSTLLSSSTFGNAISTYTGVISTVYPSSSTSIASITSTTSITSISSISSISSSTSSALPSSAHGDPQQQQQQHIPGPPYLQTQTFGGIPTSHTDAAACGVLIFLFLLGVLAHIFLFAHNKRRDRFFPLAIGVAIFSVIRIVTVALRLAWSLHHSNGHLALAATVFIGAGTVILIIVNLVMTQRIVRSQHPKFGDSRIFTVISRLFLIAVILTTILLVIAIVQAAYTLDTATRLIDRSLQLYGVTFMAVVAWLPLPILALSWLLPHSPASNTMFGPRAYRRRLIIVGLCTLFLGIRNTWFCAASWQPIARITAPLEWYFSEPVYYLIALLPELVVVLTLAILRFDRWFYIGELGEFRDPYNFSSEGDRLESPPEELLPGNDSNPKDGSTAWMKENKSEMTDSTNELQPEPYVVFDQRRSFMGLSPVTEERKSSVDVSGIEVSPKQDDTSTSQASTINNSPNSSIGHAYPIPDIPTQLANNSRNSFVDPSRLSRGSLLSAGTDFPVPPPATALMQPDSGKFINPRSSRMLSQSSYYSSTNGRPMSNLVNRQSAYYSQDLGDPVSPEATVAPLFSSNVNPTVNPATNPAIIPAVNPSVTPLVPANQVPIGSAMPLSNVHVAPSAIYQQYQRQSGINQAPPLSSHPINQQMGMTTPYVPAPMFSTGNALAQEPKLARLSTQPQALERQVSVITINERRTSHRASKSEAPVLGELKHLSEASKKRVNSTSLFSFSSDMANGVFRGSIEDWWNELKMETELNEDEEKKS